MIEILKQLSGLGGLGVVLAVVVWLYVRKEKMYSALQTDYHASMEKWLVCDQERQKEDIKAKYDLAANLEKLSNGVDDGIQRVHARIDALQKKLDECFEEDEEK